MISVRTEQGEEFLALNEFEAWIRDGRIQPHTPVRFPLLTGERWVDARDLEVFRRLYEPARIYFRRTFRLGGFPTITAALVLLEVAIFVVFGRAERSMSVDRLIELGAKTPPNVVELGETWRLLTANLLHRDVYHVLFNMLFLLNVGGTIENAYRRQDYVLILLTSALFTTILSTLMSPLPSIGASGMVLGLFGASSVFGHKYAEILPDRYKKYFEWAVLPYSLFILYVGLASKDTDNWGHLGGMLGGSLAAMFLEPKLLHLCRPKRFGFPAHKSAIAAATIAALTVGAGPVLRRVLAYEVLADAESGLSIDVPSTWDFGTNHLGYASFGNTLGVSLGLLARRAEQPVAIDALTDAFLREEIGGHKEAGEITEPRVIARVQTTIAGLPARRLIVELGSRAGAMVTENLVVARGRYAYYIVIATPKAFADAYQPILERVRGSVRIGDPARLVKARALAVEFPGMTSAKVDLAEELAATGAVEEAERALDEVLAESPGHWDASLEKATIARDYELDPIPAEAIAALLHARHPEDAGVAELLAELRLRMGQTDLARLALEETLDRTPNAAALRRRLFEVTNGEAGRTE